MAGTADLLPPNRGTFEQALAEAGDIWPITRDPITSLRGIKFNPPPSYLPFLLYEYGLGELSPYVPNLYDLIETGIPWQRVRGTPKAIERALAFLAYAGDLEEPPARRKRWNLFQIGLDRVRDDEVPDLARIEGVVGLSVPVRSVFWRAYHGYDIRAIEGGWTKWGESLYSTFSGARLPPGQTKWSFGRRYEFLVDMSEEDLTALDVWIEEGEDARPRWWHAPWPHDLWTVLDASIRSATMLAGTGDGPAWAAFKREDGSIIGYRRCRVRKGVEASPGGPYTIGGGNYAISSPSPRTLFLEALTDFGDGQGETAASVGFVLTAEPVDPDRPGQLWCEPDELDPTGPIVAEQPVDIEMGKTVRERVVALLRF